MYVRNTQGWDEIRVMEIQPKGRRNKLLVMVIGYVNYLVAVLIISGYLIIRNDLAFYKHEKMDKEQKVAKFLGRMNIVLGVFILALNWVIDTWLS